MSEGSVNTIPAECNEMCLRCDAVLNLRCAPPHLKCLGGGKYFDGQREILNHKFDINNEGRKRGVEGMGVNEVGRGTTTFTNTTKTNTSHEKTQKPRAQLLTPLLAVKFK